MLIAEIVLSVVKWCILLILSLVASMANWFLAPLVVPFASKDGWLPSWLWWFQTPDNPLDGDEGFRTLHRWWKDDPDVDTNRLKVYLNRVKWLYRNSMYGFANDVLGFIPMNGFGYESWGDEAVSNRPLHNGLVVRLLQNPDGQVFWQVYYVRAWTSTFCVRVNLGWKIWSKPNAGESCQFVMSPNPFMGYSRT